jgi:subtilase family serine protease
MFPSMILASATSALLVISLAWGLVKYSTLGMYSTTTGNDPLGVGYSRIFLSPWYSHCPSVPSILWLNFLYACNKW